VRNWKRGQFPRVYVEYGDPMQWDVVADPSRDQQQRVAEDIFNAIRALYDGLDERLKR
jgi:1-acyl-sn-glycerol-3-phosphate acyltransferase